IKMLNNIYYNRSKILLCLKHRTHGVEAIKYNKTALLIDLKTLLSLACVVQTTNLKKLGWEAKTTV
ncbi:hypothetical protein R4K52_10290, partial [Brachyspira pilosicoli]|uniref:hypothetical protein n=1 Tax=Brachyspira pilosicoli TaxID=52584 RepID=UPI003003EBF9